MTTHERFYDTIAGESRCADEPVRPRAASRCRVRRAARADDRSQACGCSTSAAAPGPSRSRPAAGAHESPASTSASSSSGAHASKGAPAPCGGRRSRAALRRRCLRSRDLVGVHRAHAPPERSVAEMLRVLRPGGDARADVPQPRLAVVHPDRQRPRPVVRIMASRTGRAGGRSSDGCGARRPLTTARRHPRVFRSS